MQGIKSQKAKVPTLALSHFDLCREANSSTGFSLWFFSEPPGDFPDKAVKHTTVACFQLLTYLPIRFFSICCPHFIPTGAVTVLWNSLATAAFRFLHFVCSSYSTLFSSFSLNNTGIDEWKSLLKTCLMVNYGYLSVSYRFVYAYKDVQYSLTRL